MCCILYICSMLHIRFRELLTVTEQTNHICAVICTDHGLVQSLVLFRLYLILVIYQLTASSYLTGVLLQSVLRYALSASYVFLLRKVVSRTISRTILSKPVNLQ